MDLEVRGWQHIQGELRLRVTLADGSVGCLPASWTGLFEEARNENPAVLSPAAVRALRMVLEPLAARTRNRRASKRNRLIPRDAPTTRR